LNGETSGESFKAQNELVVTHSKGLGLVHNVRKDEKGFVKCLIKTVREIMENAFTSKWRN